MKRDFVEFFCCCFLLSEIVLLKVTKNLLKGHDVFMNKDFLLFITET